MMNQFKLLSNRNVDLSPYPELTRDIINTSFEFCKRQIEYEKEFITNNPHNNHPKLLCSVTSKTFPEGRLEYFGYRVHQNGKKDHIVSLTCRFLNNDDQVVSYVITILQGENDVLRLDKIERELD